MNAIAFAKSEFRDVRGNTLLRGSAPHCVGVGMRYLGNVKRDLNQTIVRLFSHPISALGDVVALHDFLGRGADVKVSGVAGLQSFGNAEKVTLDGETSVAWSSTRRSVWMPAANLGHSGARQVGPAREDDVVAPGGGRAKVDCHADI